jgi:hypothetical protein
MEDQSGGEMMKAAYIDQPGPPQNIQYGDLPSKDLFGKLVLSPE